MDEVAPARDLGGDEGVAVLERIADIQLEGVGQQVRGEQPGGGPRPAAPARRFNVEDDHGCDSAGTHPRTRLASTRHATEPGSGREATFEEMVLRSGPRPGHTTIGRLTGPGN